MERFNLFTKFVAFGLLLMMCNIARAQESGSFSEIPDHEKEQNNESQSRNTQLIMINTVPAMSINGTYYEYWDYNEPDTVSGYLSDSTGTFTAPASLYLSGTKIGYYFNEFDYINEPYYIYDVTLFIRSPEDLTATLNCDHVTLTWDWEFLGYLPNINDQFEGFNIYRNDSLLNQEPVQDTFYVDRHVPDGVYDYYVETLFTDGTHSPAYDTVTVEKDYYYGDVVLNTDMGLSWSIENEVNVPSSLNGYDIYRNGEFLEATTNNYIIFYSPPEVPSEYCVVAGYNDGCYSQVGCDTVYPSVSNSHLQENQKPQLSPNPARDFVSFEHSQNYDYITITTLSGVVRDKIVLSEGSSPVRVNLQDYRRGLYLVSWYKDGIHRHTQKLIVHR